MTDTQNEAFKTPANKIRLFEHGAPGSQNLKLTRKYYTEDMPDGRVKHIVQNITDPDIVPYIPDGIGNSTDRQRIPAVLIIPGGAFRRLVYNFEGEDVAKWLNSMGIAAFVLECRLPSDEHDNAEDVPLIDAMRAMRVIRGRAQEFGIDEAKIGVMGFSAGGFMAALLSTAYESDVYADYKYKVEYDKLSARPDFAVCSYPVISIDDCIEAGKRYMSEEQVLERISDSKAKILHKYNPDKLVRPDMPPVFICETDDDRIYSEQVAMVMAVVMILHRLVSGKCFLQSGLRVLELLVKMDIVYEDKDKIILNKPAGQLSQSGKSFEMDLVSEVLTYRKSKGEEAYAAIINRLDRPVSGLVLMAKNKKEAARLSLLMQKETLCKHYQVLVCGKPDSDEGELVDNLIKDAKNNESSVVSKGMAGSKEARLKYRLLSYDEEADVSRLDIHLITGRHHQIRVQLASRNMPVAGDGKYGGNMAAQAAERIKGIRIKRGCIALCAVSLKVDGKLYEVKPGF